MYTVNTNFHISVKVPGEVLGQAQYSSVDVGGSLSISEDIEAQTEQEATEIGLERLTALAAEVKAFVFNEAGIGSMVNEDGVSLPVIQRPGVTVTATPAPAPVAQEALAQVTPIASTSTQMSASRDADGRLLFQGRPVRIYDNRAEVASAEPGSKESKRPHLNMRFLDVDDSAPYNVKFKGFWPSYKGEPTRDYPEVLALLASQSEGE